MQMSLVSDEDIISSPLNYIGGKYKLLPQILPLFPKVEGTFIDLFCGGCNVGINVPAAKTIFNDNNQNLIYLYNTIKNLDKDILFEMIDEIISKYSLSRSDINSYSFYGCESSSGLGPYNKEGFLKLRDDFNNHTNFEYRYYVMLYVLVVYSFNNQIRFNREGKFNLPVGKRDYNEKMQNKLSLFVDRLNDGNYEFSCIDFEDFDISSFGSRDFIYADPPYLITCATYNEQNGWNEEKEKSLYRFLDKATEHGIKFALSNVLSSGGKENILLREWLEKNKKRYNVTHLNFNYSNSNYQKKNRQIDSDEVLITNYLGGTDYIMPHFTFQSYSWSLGTTSFRMADFHRKVEEQLVLLNDFWNIPENNGVEWSRESGIQKKYYEYLLKNGFIYGKIDKDEDKEKTAREKTSGLVDIGLIDDTHRLTEVGEKLLAISKSGDFSSDNEFHIPCDSFLYLKQLIKTANKVQESYVRPYLVTGLVLESCDGYLTDDEFTYLLPLCVNADITNKVINYILSYRKGKTTIDKIIVDVVLTKYSYPAAKRYFISSKQTDDDIMDIGMNRKSPTYDKCYVELYKQLKNVYIHRDESSISSLYQATGSLKGGKTLWRKLLFSAKKPKKYADLSATPFDKIIDEKQFNSLFFDYLHLHKIKANLSDYKDLNRRYLNITDSILFSDGKVCFTPIFQNFFKTRAKSVFDDAYSECSLLRRDCALSDINSSLIFDNRSIISVFNKENGTSFKSIDEVYNYIEDNRYSRFRELIDSKFSNNVIIDMLDKFETRTSDSEIIAEVGSEADIPTIFEYITAVAWYRISGYKGKILDYMNLSLDVNLLPRTHAGGGMSDIVYKYKACSSYPAHDLLIECTLMEGTTQRHGEMEPVSRHLANYLIDENPNAYCTFVSNNLHASVISDFRGRKSTSYYRNDTEHVDGMKIIPLHTQELKTILEKGITYDTLYKLFDKAFISEDVIAPPKWYKQKIKLGIECL